MNLLADRIPKLKEIRDQNNLYSEADKAERHDEVREAYKKLASLKTPRARALREKLRSVEQKRRARLPLKRMLLKIDKRR